MAEDLTPQTPLINGVAYDHASAEITLADKVYDMIESLDFEDNLEPKDQRGTRPEVLARTLGEYKASATMHMPQQWGNAFVDQLGDGYLAKVFDINVNYSFDGQPNINRKLVAARITNIKEGSKTGGDPNMMEFSLHLMRIERNGKLPVPGMLV